MDDQFFAKLREIQRKERANSSLARVGNDFYTRTHRYLDSIREVARNDPFSDENDLLKIVQRIATEICEMREHKIASAAIMNIHRSYHLFQGKPQFDLVDTTPLNITEEEETLYFSFIDVLKNHRRRISLDQLTTNNEAINNDIVDDKIVNSNVANDNIINDTISTDSGNIDNGAGNNINIADNKLANNKLANNKVANDNITNNTINNANISDNEDDKNNKLDKSNLKEDKILNRLNNIKSAKIIEEETHEPIEKQISKSKYSENDINSNKYEFKQTKSQTPVSSDLKDKKNGNIDNNIKAGDVKVNNIETNDVKVNNVKNNDTKNNDVKANNSIKSKSKVSNVVGNEDEQFIDLNYLNQDVPNDLDYNSQNRNKSKSTIDKIANVMILIFSEIDSIIGVDKKIYGPFKPQDIVIMPDINAEILVKNKKGRLINA